MATARYLGGVAAAVAILNIDDAVRDLMESIIDAVFDVGARFVGNAWIVRRLREVGTPHRSGSEH